VAEEVSVVCVCTFSDWRVYGQGFDPLSSSSFDQLKFGEMSTGAQDDLQKITRYAVHFSLLFCGFVSDLRLSLSLSVKCMPKSRATA